MNPLIIDESPFLQRASRFFGALVLAAILMRRLWLWGAYGPESSSEHFTLPGILMKALWILETLFFLMLFISYLFRDRAKSYARGFMEAVFPYICSSLPFVLARSSFWPSADGREFTRIHWGGILMNVTQVQISPWPLVVIVSVMLAGIIITSSSVPYMIRSFSIKAEVRRLVVNGPYRYVRHPIYLGEFISSFGLLLLRFSWINLLIFLIFVFAQNYRATLEELKIQSLYPEYEEYKRSTGKFFPGLP